MKNFYKEYNKELEEIEMSPPYDCSISLSKWEEGNGGSFSPDKPEPPRQITFRPKLHGFYGIIDKIYKYNFYMDILFYLKSKKWPMKISKAHEKEDGYVFVVWAEKDRQHEEIDELINFMFYQRAEI